MRLLVSLAGSVSPIAKPDPYATPIQVPILRLLLFLHTQTPISRSGAGHESMHVVEYARGARQLRPEG